MSSHCIVPSNEDGGGGGGGGGGSQSAQSPCLVSVSGRGGETWSSVSVRLL